MKDQYNTINWDDNELLQGIFNFPTKEILLDNKNQKQKDSNDNLNEKEKPKMQKIFDNFLTDGSNHVKKNFQNLKAFSTNIKSFLKEENQEFHEIFKGKRKIMQEREKQKRYKKILRQKRKLKSQKKRSENLCYRSKLTEFGEKKLQQSKIFFKPINDDKGKLKFKKRRRPKTSMGVKRNLKNFYLHDLKKPGNKMKIKYFSKKQKEKDFSLLHLDQNYYERKKCRVNRISYSRGLEFLPKLKERKQAERIRKISNFIGTGDELFFERNQILNKLYYSKNAKKYQHVFN